jgi:hypothetical protein
MRAHKRAEEAPGRRFIEAMPPIARCSSHTNGVPAASSNSVTSGGNLSATVTTIMSCTTVDRLVVRPQGVTSMTRKKIKPVDQYAFLTISLDTFSSAVNMSVNGQARDRRQDNDNVSLYSFGCDVEIHGTCIYPPERVHENYRIDISTKPQSQLNFDAKLKDTRVMDEDDSFKYRKVRGRRSLSTLFLKASGFWIRNVEQQTCMAGYGCRSKRLPKCSSCSPT